MAQGGVTATVTPVGGKQRAGGATLARNVVALAVSPKGTPETLYTPASLAAILSAFDTGPLAELCAQLQRSGQNLYAVPLTPSSAGKLGTVVQTGTGTGTVTPTLAPHRAIMVLCSTSGNLGTAAFRFSLDGGVTYSDPVTSSNGGGTDDWNYRVPGTFCTLTFAYGAPTAYTASKTLTVGLNGTVTAGTLWTGTVTQVSSPIDNYDVRVTVVKAGALGTCTVRVSLDGGRSSLPDFAVPSGGVVIVPDTGLVLTLANTFVIDEYYSFYTCAPGYSTSDITAALTALRASAGCPTVALIVNGGLASSASGAFSAAATLQSALDTAFTAGLDWQAMTDGPVVGDTVISGGAAIADTADTDATIRTATAAATECRRVAVNFGTHRMTSTLTGAKLRRPLGWALADRYVDTEPRQSLAAPDPLGPLRIFAIGRDERLASTSLHDVRVNIATTYPGSADVYLSIERGGFGYRHFTSNAAYQDGEGVRVLNVYLAALRVRGVAYLAQRPRTNSDGTIEERVRRAWTADFDAVGKRAVGLLTGGDFTEAQASTAVSNVLATSQLGQAPRELAIEYDLQTLGFVSNVSNNVRYGGVLAVQG